LGKDEGLRGDVRKSRQRRFLTTRITCAFPIHQWGFSLWSWNLNLLEVFDNKYIFIAYEESLLRYLVQDNGRPEREPDKRVHIGHVIHFLKRGRLCGIEVVAISHQSGGVEIFDCENFDRIGSTMHTPNPSPLDRSIWSLDMRGNLLVIGSNTRLLQVIEFRLRDSNKEELKEDMLGSLSRVDKIVEIEPESSSEWLQTDENPISQSINQFEPDFNDIDNDNTSSSEWGTFENLLLTSTTLRYIKGHNHNIPSVVLNESGDRALTSCIDATVRIIDIHKGVIVRKSKKTTRLGGEDWMWNAVYVPQDAVYQIPHSPESIYAAEEQVEESCTDEMEQKRISRWCCWLPRWPRTRSSLMLKGSEPKARVQLTDLRASTSPSAVMLSEEIVTDEDSKTDEMRRYDEARQLSNPIQRRQWQSTDDDSVTHKRTKRAVIFRAIKNTWGLQIPNTLIDIIMAYASEFYVITTSKVSGVFGSSSTYLHLRDGDLNLVRSYPGPLEASFTPGIPRSLDRLHFFFRLGECPLYCVASPACRSVLLLGLVQDHDGEINIRTYGEVSFNSNLLFGPSFITGVTAAKVRPLVYRLYVTRSQSSVGNLEDGYIEAHDIEILLPM